MRQGRGDSYFNYQCQLQWKIVSSHSLTFQILLQLEKHEIQIYNFPVSEMDPEHHWMRERMPFAVVGSNMTITDPGTGQMYRGREYPWGCVNIEDKVRGPLFLGRMKKNTSISLHRSEKTKTSESLVSRPGCTVPVLV